MNELIEECREKIRYFERKAKFFQDHNCQEEVRVLQTKIGGMFQIYDMLKEYSDRAPKGGDICQ